MEKYKGKYFGPTLIKTVETLESKSYLGKERVKITFEDNSIFKLPLSMLIACVTDEAIDLTKLREKKIVPVSEQILAILADSELGRENLMHILSFTIPESIKMSHDEAERILFNKSPEDISLYDIEQVLNKK